MNYVKKAKAAEKRRPIKESLKIGIKVVHENKRCEIIEKWWDDYSEMRYYVYHSGFTRSVTQRELKVVKNRAVL